VSVIIVPRYRLTDSLKDPQLWSVRDVKTGRDSREGYLLGDAIALRNWLNERAAGYPPNPALVC